MLVGVNELFEPVDVRQFKGKKKKSFWGLSRFGIVTAGAIYIFPVHVFVSFINYMNN